MLPVEGMGGRFVLGILVPKERFERPFDKHMAVLQNAARMDG